MRLIDLSHPISDKMPVFPSDTPVTLFQEKKLNRDSYNNFRLETGMHSGTHIDSPMHLIDSTVFIKDIPLEKFIGNGCILDVRHQKIITVKENHTERVKENDIVLLFTEHSNEFGNENYFFDYPVLDISFAEFLVNKKIKMLGIDSPSPDKFPFGIHKLLLDHNIMIIENLTNLASLLPYSRFEIVAFPLNIEADSSLVRVVAKVAE